MSTRGVAFRLPVDLGDPPDLSDGLCVGDPLGWDIDALRHDRDAVEAARRRCRYECPAFVRCHGWTQRLADAGYPPDGVIQAAKVWGNLRSRPAAPGPLTPEMRQAHAAYVRLRNGGVPKGSLPPEVIEGERAYQAARKRRPPERAA